MTTAVFTPPSPGSWELERTHATRPLARFMWDVFPGAMMRGFSEATREYGALLDHIELVVIDGFVYSAPRAVGAPKGATGPPPRFVFKLLVRLHPEVRRRVKRSEAVFRDRIWRRELRWWDEEVKPSIARDAQALSDVDPATLADAALAEHVRRAAGFLRRTIYYHHRLNCCAMVPLADFLAHATMWTGLAPQEILPAMRGRSPLSAGATAELESLRVAIIADGQAMLLLLSDRPAGALVAELEAWPGAVGAAMRAYTSVVGLRVIGGYDVADRHAREHPDLLLNVIRAAVTGTGDGAPQPETEAAVDAVRQRVPAEHRAEFDALLREARLTYRVRDERNFCSDAIGVGLARRAILTAGDRLRATGRAEDPLHLVDASEAEIVSLLERGEGPRADELAARYQRRMRTTLDAAPARLGLPPSAPPPADWLPGGAARLQRAVGLALDLMFAVPEQAETPGKPLSGFGVSPGVFEGPARVILDVADLPTVRAGEILITPSTGPTFNVVLPLLKALVTERGGALSHAAIVAREYGIPAIVGCAGATAAVTTGTRVRVDGSKGEMWIVG